MAMRVRVIVAVGRASQGVLMSVRVGVYVLVVVGVRVSLRLAFLGPKFLARQLFFAGSDHVDLGGADAAAIDPRNLQTRIYAQGLDRAGEELGRNSGVKQGA